MQNIHKSKVKIYIVLSFIFIGYQDSSIADFRFQNDLNQDVKFALVPPTGMAGAPWKAAMDSNWGMAQYDEVEVKARSHVDLEDYPGANQGGWLPLTVFYDNSTEAFVKYIVQIPGQADIVCSADVPFDLKAKKRLVVRQVRGQIACTDFNAF